MTRWLVALVLALVLIWPSGLQADDATPLPEPEVVYYESYEYKLFYGQWEITRKISQSQRVDPKMGDLTGCTMEYNRSTALFGNETEPVHVMLYDIAIVPITQIPFIEYMDSPAHLGLTGNFFVWVNVQSSDTRPFHIGEFFYIVDDETLVIFEDGCYYEAKRISHIKNYEMSYQHI